MLGPWWREEGCTPYRPVHFAHDTVHHSRHSRCGLHICTAYSAHCTLYILCTQYTGHSHHALTAPQTLRAVHCALLRHLGLYLKKPLALVQNTVFCTLHCCVFCTIHTVTLHTAQRNACRAAQQSTEHAQLRPSRAGIMESQCYSTIKQRDLHGMDSFWRQTTSTQGPEGQASQLNALKTNHKSVTENSRGNPRGKSQGRRPGGGGDRNRVNPPIKTPAGVLSARNFQGPQGGGGHQEVFGVHCQDTTCSTVCVPEVSPPAKHVKQDTIGAFSSHELRPAPALALGFARGFDFQIPVCDLVKQS